MKIIKALQMAVGMFSTFPTPKDSWDDACRGLVIPLFPAIGALIGGVWYGVSCLLLWAGLPLALVAALAGLSPFFASGCLHLDGWMDTMDAFFSRRELEEKKRILKDPHMGAFAVAGLAGLFVVHFAAFYTVLDGRKALLGLVFLCTLSRVAVGLALLNRKPFADTGYMVLLQQGKKPVHTLWLLGVGIGMLLLAATLDWKIAAACMVALLAAAVAEEKLLRSMGGLSGDLCGCILTASEVCGLLCLAIL